MRVIALFLLLAGSADFTEAPLPRPIAIEVLASAPKHCKFRIDGRKVSQSALKQALQAESDKLRGIQLSVGKGAPWRCVAGAVHELKMAGFETVDFISAPHS